ncbi:hypothetical protein [Arthrobacter sp. 2MCAF14]|uniref:hypothetical protein n=1 Tax=Arthrobacter sp. 2MCAF14 TaxID=3232982 RepID=UPI003F935A2B
MTRINVVSMIMIVVVTLTSCSSAGVADSRHAGAPPGVEVTLSGAPVAFAPGNGSIEIVTWGSSSCPPTATLFTVKDGSASVTFDLSTGSPCTTDIAATTHVFGPEKVGKTIPETAHITFTDLYEQYDVKVIRG